jgi:hypothetical protein
VAHAPHPPCQRNQYQAPDAHAVIVALSVAPRLRRALDELEAKLTIAQGAYREPAPFVWRVGLVVTPPAERDQSIQVEV